MLTDSCSNIGLGVSPVIQWCLGCSLGKDMYNHPHFKTINELSVYLSRGLLVWGVVLGLSLYVRRTYFVSLIGDVKRTSAILYTLGHSDGRVFKALLLRQCRARPEDGIDQVSVLSISGYPFFLALYPAYCV